MTPINTPGQPHLSRRQLLQVGSAVGLSGLVSRTALARDTALPVPASLITAADDAARQREPLVVLMSLPGCPYCELVRRNYLLPMRATGLHAWQLDVTDRQTRIVSFDGRSATGGELAAQWKAKFTPTVLFFNPKGQEVAERLVGATPDFFGGYLDQALDTARSRLART
jgi:thioredoxin-related protein